jgi:hypothetical protein
MDDIVKINQMRPTTQPQGMAPAGSALNQE